MTQISWSERTRFRRLDLALNEPNTKRSTSVLPTSTSSINSCLPAQATDGKGTSRGYGCNIAIIGGGFTGTTLAAQLLHGATPSLSVVLIERRPCLGRDVAYATRCAAHLLNVPAENMSAFADDPTHFLRWARRRLGRHVEPCDFLPRSLYGEYVESVLWEEVRQRPGQFKWRCEEACAVTCTGRSLDILLHNGEAIRAERVVLALGNSPPSDPLLPGRSNFCQRYVPDPWADNAFERLTPASDILLIGSGLTSVDVAVAARTRGFKGTIHILSRHGLLPKGHRLKASRASIWSLERFPSTAHRLLRWVRRQTETAEGHGFDWYLIVDSLRPFTQQIWQSLPNKEQRRFLRHVRPYWEVHRHRLAPEIAALIASEIGNGQIQIRSGRITAFHENIEGVEITYRDRKSGKLESLRVDCVFNCTGPELDCRKVSDPLMRDLVSQELACPDPLFLGLQVSEAGALIDSHGRASDLIYTIGPARKGVLWETTAVPEIRDQIAELVKHLVASCAQNDSAIPESAQGAVTTDAGVEVVGARLA